MVDENNVYKLVFRQLDFWKYVSFTCNLCQHYNHLVPILSKKIVTSRLIPFKKKKIKEQSIFWQNKIEL